MFENNVWEGRQFIFCRLATPIVSPSQPNIQVFSLSLSLSLSLVFFFLFSFLIFYLHFIFLLNLDLFGSMGKNDDKSACFCCLYF